MNKLDAQETSALLDALDDEYKSWSTYDQVIRDFGAVRPFINIREAENRHVQALLELCRRYGVTPPANRWPGKVTRFDDLRAACEAGVSGEIENVALYDRLLAATSRPDMLAVFGALRRASQERHLRAFRRCAQRRREDRPQLSQRWGDGAGRCNGRAGRPHAGAQRQSHGKHCAWGGANL